AGAHATVTLGTDRGCELDVLLDLPLHSAAGAAAAVVQPRLPLRAGAAGEPLHRAGPVRGPHQRADDAAGRGGAGPGPAPGGLCGGDDPRRHPLGGPGPAGGGERARDPRPRPLAADRAAPGDASDPPARLQRGDRTGPGHLDRLRARPCGAVLHRPADLRTHPGGAADAAGRDALVRGDHLGAVDRAVLHRAPLLEGGGAHPAAHPAAEAPGPRGPAAPHPDGSRRMRTPTRPRHDPSAAPAGPAPVDAPRGGRVEIRGVHKSFGDLEVLRGIDLTISPGSVTVILGPSGSGKSTLLRTINHLETLTQGLISVDDEVIGYRLDGDLLHELREKEVLRQRTAIGMVFQSFNLFAHMTALANVAEAPRRA